MAREARFCGPQALHQILKILLNACMNAVVVCMNAGVYTIECRCKYY